MAGGATAGWSNLLDLARQAEDLGFDSLWVPATSSWGLTAMRRRSAAGSAGRCTGYRNPALLAKIASTVDEISGSRLILGLGAGWAESEFRAFGFPFDHRVARFQEAIQIITGLLRNGRLDFRGTYSTVRDCELLPRGPRPHGPPIMVGASGSRMLGLTARYADAWNADFGSDPESIRGLNDAVDAACRVAGRDPATLGRSASVFVDVTGHSRAGDNWVADVRAIQALSGSSEELATALRAFAYAGIEHVQIWLDPSTIAGVEALAPVLELLDGTE
jgi:alkanesulfonate monooxygenase SsuD/methylene tetrahydromethanopterin reductase-like flavin-dependent oxidoreductase (luciferase family)